jgi:hypothetical protein
VGGVPNSSRTTHFLPDGGDARSDSATGTVRNLNSEVIAWLMKPDPTGLELPDLADLMQRSDWFARASCRGSEQSPFFPGKGGSANGAQAICAACRGAG